jgi:polygalacturonase
MKDPRRALRIGIVIGATAAGATLSACGSDRSAPGLVVDGATSGQGPSGSPGEDSGDTSSGSSSGAGVSPTGVGGSTSNEGGTTEDAAVGRADGASATSGGTVASCAGDANLPPEPTIPPACKTLTASQTVSGSAVPSEAMLDTSRIQSALNGCAQGSAVQLVTNGSNNAFVTGPLNIPSGVTLWVDAGVTLYGTRNPSVYGSASALIMVTGANSGIVGNGTIDGQGGEPLIGKSGSFWDANGAGGSSPALIQASGATSFTLYKITLHNSPKFHVKVGATGFIVWGITIKTPSKPMSSAGTALTPSSAHNTDGVDPGEAASNGYIVCSNISDGDDHIAIKGGTGVKNLTIAHNHFLAGHGMSIGSETNGGVSDIKVYDLSIDGTGSGLGGGSSNGIRIKSDPSRGGQVTNVTYTDVCVRKLANPILLTPHYSSATGSEIPQYTNITIRDFHALSSGTVTIDGYDAAHATGITLDNVVVDGISPSNVSASYAKITLGPGSVNFTPSGTGVTVQNDVSGSSSPNPCTGKWVTF